MAMLARDPSMKDVFTNLFGDSEDEESDVESEAGPVEGQKMDLGMEAPSTYDWRPVEGVEGLWLCEGFLSSAQQDRLMACVGREGWFATPAANQAMRFFDLPPWARSLSAEIRRAASTYHSPPQLSEPAGGGSANRRLPPGMKFGLGAASPSGGSFSGDSTQASDAGVAGPASEVMPGGGCLVDAPRPIRRCPTKDSGQAAGPLGDASCIGALPGVKSLPDGAPPEEGPLPEHLLQRQPLFDQMIANSYQPGEGIGPHIDLMRFEDGIAIVSLLSPCVMNFSRVKRSAEGGLAAGDANGTTSPPTARDSAGRQKLPQERGRHHCLPDVRPSDPSSHPRVGEMVEPLCTAGSGARAAGGVTAEEGSEGAYGGRGPTEGRGGKGDEMDFGGKRALGRSRASGDAAIEDSVDCGDSLRCCLLDDSPGVQETALSSGREDAHTSSLIGSVESRRSDRRNKHGDNLAREQWRASVAVSTLEGDYGLSNQSDHCRECGCLEDKRNYSEILVNALDELGDYCQECRQLPGRQMAPSSSRMEPDAEGYRNATELQAVGAGTGVTRSRDMFVRQKRRRVARSEIAVLLSPGDLLLMSGEARYEFTHAIYREKGRQVWDGCELTQGERVSITLRRMCPQPENEDGQSS